MGTGLFGMGAMWGFPLLGLLLILLVLFVALGRGNSLPPSQSALDILKNRYAKGELTKEEFDRMKKDLLS